MQTTSSPSSRNWTSTTTTKSQTFGRPAFPLATFTSVFCQRSSRNTRTFLTTGALRTADTGKRRPTRRTAICTNGTCGTVRRNRGTTGTYLRDDSFPNLECSFCKAGCGCDPRTHTPYREAYPNIRTVDYWTGGDISECYPQSRYVSV